MSRGIVSLRDADGTLWYFEWSTIVDAPVTYRMTRAELEQYVSGYEGADGVRELALRMERVDSKGASFRDDDRASVLLLNKAGPDDGHLSEAQICECYASPQSYKEWQARNGGE